MSEDVQRLLPRERVRTGERRAVRKNPDGLCPVSLEGILWLDAGINCSAQPCGPLASPWRHPGAHTRAPVI